MKTDPDICVCNPITENFTTFEILIQTGNPAFNLRQSTTRRRYNDFCWLRKVLKKHHPLCTCPELPEKKKFSERFQIQFLVQRMKELEDWLQRILSVSLYLSDTAVHLFLQSSLTCRQIEQYLNGKLSESQLQQAYRDAELQQDTSSASLGSGARDDTSGGADGSSGATARQSVPVEIRTQPPDVLHSSMQERSDSGFDGLESDAESSYDSQGSPYVSSLDSAMISGKYPPLTEVCPVVSNKSENKDPRENGICQLQSSTNSDKDLVNEHHRQKANLEDDQSLEFKNNTISSDDSINSDIQLNAACQKTSLKIPATASKHSISHSGNSQSAWERGASCDTEQSAIASNVEAGIKAKQATHKVEMGVLYC